MSASRERKKRIEQEQNSVAAQQPVQKKKISEGLIFAVVILLIVVALLGFVLGRGIWQRNQTVLTVGEHEVSVKEFNYFYHSIANNYLTYASYFGTSYGVDASIPLDQQVVTTDHVNFLTMLSMYGYLTIDTSYLNDHSIVADGAYDVTMAQLFADCAKTQALSCYVTYDDAVANGYELDAECLAEIDAEMESMKQQGKETYGWSLNKTIKNTFGEGCNKDSYYDYLVLTHTATHYVKSLSYSDAEIEARYNESAEDFDIATFYYYTVSAKDFVEADEEGNRPDPTELEEEKAKTAAEAMEQNFDLEDEEKTVTLITDYTHEYVKDLCGEDAAAWIFDEATAKDAVKLFEVEGTYYVLKLLDKSDYDLVNVLQIYIPKDAEGVELAEGELSAADKVAAVAAGLESDASEDNFRALAAEHSDESAEVQVEELTRGSLSGVSEESCLWAMEAGRAVGDYAQFEVSGGTIFLLVTGFGDSYVEAAVSSVLASEWLEAAVETAELVCGYNEKVAMYGNVGLAISSAQ